jgi:Na+/H+-dicarboxylate symporter
MFVALFIVSFTLPGCPGAVLIGLSTVFAAVGIPLGAVMLFLCIDPIVSMINTVGNVTSNITSTIILGHKKENGDAP